MCFKGADEAIIGADEAIISAFKTSSKSPCHNHSRYGFFGFWRSVFKQERKQLVSIAVLAGGQSKRLGRDKAFSLVAGRPMIERILNRLRPLTDDLFISTNSPEKYKRFGLPTVADVYPNKAALGGIFSVITAARHHHVLVVACDMPFLNIDLLGYLIDLAPTADVVVPLIKPPQPETLHAIYSKKCLPAIKSRLLVNQLRIVDFYDEVSVRYVERAEIVTFDPDLHSFINMNTPEDWQKVQAMAKKLF
jgi:molybdopterin-guanine dinucleotide biosynthesis protein A